MKLQVTNIHTGQYLYSHFRDKLQHHVETDNIGGRITTYLNPSVQYFWSGSACSRKQAKHLGRNPRFVVLNPDQLKSYYPDTQFPKGQEWMVFKLVKGEAYASHVDIPAFEKGRVPEEFELDGMQYLNIVFEDENRPKSNLEIVE